MAQSELRNRSGKQSTRSKKEKSGAKQHRQKKNKSNENQRQLTSSADGGDPPSGEEVEPTMWQTFKSHPLVIISPYLLVPAALYYGCRYVALNRPDLVTAASLGLASLRPAVRTEDPRQVLVLGSLGSGVIQVAEALRNVMKLELYHEVADATSVFTRDGTASSLLAWRYSDDLSEGRLSQVLNDLCLNRTKDTQLFQPSMFQPTQCFSMLGGWSKCHSKECVKLIGREYGCALRKGPKCQPEFVRVLHQARHPLRTISELMSSVCPTYAQKKNCTIHPAFAQFATVFVDRKSEFDNCLAIVAWYVIRYNRALLKARAKGLVHAMFTYEGSNLCDVARLAGFTEPDQVLYPPNLPKITSQCSPDAVAKPGAAQAKPLPALVSATDKTRTFHEFSWNSFDEAGGGKLVGALKKVCTDMGYNPEESKVVEDVLLAAGEGVKEGVTK